MPTKQEIDYSVYLVTGRELLPEGKDYYQSLEEALQGGVTVVQVREKDAETGEFVEIARRTKEICDKYSVPLLINDRIDVYLAIQCAGVHIGQTDMDLAGARALVGEEAIVGVSVSSVEEAEAAAAGGADYVGIGAVWPTESKDVRKKRKLGPEGVGKVLDVLPDEIRSVAIGGISLQNTAHLLHGSISPERRRHLDGVAVISAIVGSQDPKARAQELAAVVGDFISARSWTERGFFRGGTEDEIDFTEDDEGDVLIQRAAALLDVVKANTPLIHQMTNNVVINDSANATLAVGASPIMATNPRDVADLSPAIGALLVNFGTIQDKDGMLVGGRCANLNGKPVVFDPVAVGATAFRKETSKELLSHWQPTVIKGNPAEIGYLAQSEEVAARGVDSTGSFKDPAGIVRSLARASAAIVVMTGPVDYISDGDLVLSVNNGDDYLEAITGSGCMTGTLVATFCAAARLASIKDGVQAGKSSLAQGDMLVGALAGCLAFTIAAEIAAAREDVRGPGTFRAALIDELYNLKRNDIEEHARVKIVGGVRFG